jgi:hypothetical protein
MKSVADTLQSDTVRDVARLSVTERVALALELGDRAVALFASANHVSESEARRTLRRNNQIGRRPSEAARID